MVLNETTKIEPNRYSLSITVGGEEYRKALEASYRKNAGRITVPGFRKGRAPKGCVLRYVGEEYFYEDAMNLSYPQAYEEAVREAGLEPVARPEVEVTKIDGQSYTFTAKVTTRPEVILGEYRGLRVKRREDPVDDGDVMRRLGEMAGENARFVEAEDGARAVPGDMVTFDCRIFRGDSEIRDEGGRGSTLELGVPTATGIEKAFPGHSAGETFDFPLTYPENHHKPALSGRRVTARITLTGIKRKEVPEIDDEFAKDVGDFDTLDELKESLRTEMRESASAEADRRLTDELLEAGVRNMRAEIPPVMFEERALESVRLFAAGLAARGHSLEEYLRLRNLSFEDLTARFLPDAEKQVRTGLFLDAVIEAERLDVTEEEMDGKYQEMADELHISADNVRERYSDDEVRRSVLSAKVCSLMRDTAVVS